MRVGGERLKIRNFSSLALLIATSLLLAGCKRIETSTQPLDTEVQKNEVENSEEELGMIKDGIEKEDIKEVQVFADRNFKNGFYVRSQTDGVATPLGVITFEQTEIEPSWSIGQWYCGYYYRQNQSLYDSYNFLKAKRTDNDSKHTFVDASKKVTLDTETGEMYLRLEGSKEYLEPREQNQPWPHLLFEYNTEEQFKVSELKSLRFNTEFTITKMKSGFVNEAQIDSNLHTAQFVFYIIVKNTNPASPDFNNFIWFGLNLYDARWEIVPAYASQDSGKEINTGAFIYQPISSTYCKVPTRVAEQQIIDYDLLPRIEDALTAAKQAGFLKNTHWEDLSLCGGNFGFEVTGTYDIAAEISKLDLWAGK